MWDEVPNLHRVGVVVFAHHTYAVCVGALCQVHGTMNLINVKVIANARRNEVTEEQGRFKVRVTAPAAEGRANKAVIELLVGYLNVKKSALKITRGARSAQKVIMCKPLDTATNI